MSSASKSDSPILTLAQSLMDLRFVTIVVFTLSLVHNVACFSEFSTLGLDILLGLLPASLSNPRMEEQPFIDTVCVLYLDGSQHC